MGEIMILCPQCSASHFRTESYVFSLRKNLKCPKCHCTLNVNIQQLKEAALTEESESATIENASN